MSKSLYLLATLAALSLSDVHAGDRVVSESVIYHCLGKQAVGYRNGTWAAGIFENRLKFKIEERKWASGLRYWTVRVLYKDWVFVGANNRDDQRLFLAEGGLAGQYFVLDVRTGKFSFMDSLGYMQDDSADTAHMSVGLCRPA